MEIENFEVKITEDFFKETVTNLNSLRNEEGGMTSEQYECNCILARALRNKGVDDPRVSTTFGKVKALNKYVSRQAMEAMNVFDSLNARDVHVDPDEAWDAFKAPTEFMMFREEGE